MSFKSLHEDASVDAKLLGAGINPEKGFRFATPLPPYSAKENIHISKTVINKSQFSLDDLKSGTVLRVSVTGSTNRYGNLSWTATAIEELPTTIPLSHVGVIDSGGMQHLYNDRIAWFLEDVFPKLPPSMNKCVVFKKSLSTTGRAQSDSMVPQTVLMFKLARDRVNSAELFDPERLETDFLLSLLRERANIKTKGLIQLLTVLCKRTGELPDGYDWNDFHEDVQDKVIENLSKHKVLKVLASAFTDQMIDVCFRNLPAEESLELFPNHPLAWMYSSTAYLLCTDLIQDGKSLNYIIDHLEENETAVDVWEQIGVNHQSWVEENIYPPEKFQKIQKRLNDQSLNLLLAALDFDDILSVQALIPWLPESKVSSALNCLFDGDFEPDDMLKSQISKRFENSQHELSNEVLMWLPQLWRSSDPKEMIAIVECQKKKLFEPNHKTIISLISQAVGNYIANHTEKFANPDYWSGTPSADVAYFIDVVNSLPEVEEELQIMSAFGIWDISVQIEGPSRIWQHRESLGNAWQNFTPNEKILALHYLLANNLKIPAELDPINEDHPMIVAYLTLVFGAMNGDREESSLKAHNLITEAVLKKVPAPGAKVAISQTELNIDFERAIPRCGIPESSGVRFCEGNHRTKPSYSEWLRKIPSRDITPDMRDRYECHCPRLERKKGGYRDSGCEVETGDGNGSARLFECRKLPWTQWTILEVLAVLGFPPNLISYFSAQGRKPRVQSAHINHNEYANKVAAVVNRIDDLRDRLRCGWRDGHIDPQSGCGNPLTPNFSYRVFPAAYGITVMGGCQEPSIGPHDKSAYFNHCKRCITIIDSRESPIKDDSSYGTYVCASCGGWGQEGPYEFRKCGKCGSYDSVKSEGRRKFIQCKSCKHSWYPPEKFWSGIQ